MREVCTFPAATPIVPIMRSVHAPRQLVAALAALLFCGTAYAQDNLLAVLCYHNISPVKTEDSAYSVTGEILASHVTALRADGFAFVSMEQVRDFYGSGKPLPAKSALITFDDGRLSVFELARPLLKSLGLPWAMFVYPTAINAGHDRKFMNWDDLRTLAAEGVAIGSHAYDHPYLTKPPAEVATPEAYQAWLDRQLGKSRLAIERELGKPVYAFAIPFGAINREAQARLGPNGYSLAFNIFGSSNDSGTDPLQLNRILVMASQKPEKLVARAREKPLHFALQLPLPLDTVTGSLDRLSFSLPGIAGLDPASIEIRLDGNQPGHSVSAKGEIVVPLTAPAKDKTYLVSVRATARTGQAYSQSWFFSYRSRKPAFLKSKAL